MLLLKKVSRKKIKRRILQVLCAVWYFFLKKYFLNHQRKPIWTMNWIKCHMREIFFLRYRKVSIKLPKSPKKLFHLKYFSTFPSCYLFVYIYWIDGSEELEYFDWYIQILFKEFIILTNYQVSVEFFGFWFSIKNNTLISTYEWDMITMANSIRVGLQKQINMATQSATVYINTIAISCFSFIIFCDIVFHEKS